MGTELVVMERHFWEKTGQLGLFGVKYGGNASKIMLKEVLRLI
jgi:hypothetical protein